MFIYPFCFSNRMDEVEEALHTIGFDEKEVLMYVALLKRGESSATIISKETGIERTLVYYILERLLGKGLVSFKQKNNVKYYAASDPKNILVSLNEKLKVYKNVLPTLQKMKRATSDGDLQVDVFKGFEGSKAVLRDIFKTKKEILVLGEQGQLQKEYPEYKHVYFHSLEKTNIQERVIVREDLRGKVGSSKKSEFRYVSKDSISPTTTTISDDKIIITVWEKPTYHIVIKSKKIADSYKTYFQHVWKGAKK